MRSPSPPGARPAARLPRALAPLSLALAAAACRPAPATPPRAASEPRAALDPLADVAASDGPSEVVVHAPDPDEAFSYLWYVLGQMPFFREHGYLGGQGYQVVVPDAPVFRRFVDDPSARATEAERPALAGQFAREVYRRGDFLPAMARFRAGAGHLTIALGRLRDLERRWGLRVLPRYDVQLTLYGPGGSYFEESHTIVVATTRAGAFKGGGGLQTVVHEMMHVGVEDAIVRRYALSHVEKEVLVDLLCQLAFGDLPGGYTQQQYRGQTELPAYLDARGLEDAPSAVAAYVAAHPR